MKNSERMNESTMDDDDWGNSISIMFGKIVRCLSVISDNLKVRELFVLVKELNETIGSTSKWQVIDWAKQPTPSFNMLRESTSSMSDAKLYDERDSPNSTPIKMVLE